MNTQQQIHPMPPQPNINIQNSLTNSQQVMQQQLPPQQQPLSQSQQQPQSQFKPIILPPQQQPTPPPQQQLQQQQQLQSTQTVTSLHHQQSNNKQNINNTMNNIHNNNNNTTNNNNNNGVIGSATIPLPIPSPTINKKNDHMPSTTQQMVSHVQQMNSIMQTNSTTNSNNNVNTLPQNMQTGIEFNSSLSQQLSVSKMQQGLSAFADPLEQSLASFEQTIKNEVNHMHMMHDMSMMIKSEQGLNNAMQQQNLIQSLGFDTQLPHHLPNNGFIDNCMANGLINGMGLNPNAGMPLMMHTGLSTSNNSLVSSLFEQSHQSNSRAPPPIYPHVNIPPSITSQNSLPTIKKEEKLLLTPKPIEDLLMNPNEKKMAPPDMKNSNFVQAFKSHEQNLKNAGSWSSLGFVSSGSPQNIQASTKPKPHMDTFQTFRNKAKEKADREKLLEQQELKRTQKEQAEKAEKEMILKRQQELKQKERQEELNNGRLVIQLMVNFLS